MQVIFLVCQDDRKSLRMKSTAKQENNLNFKKDSYIPQNVQTLAPGGLQQSGGDAGHVLAGKIRHILSEE